MIPYKEASEQIKKQHEAPGKALKAAASLAIPATKTGVGIATGGAMLKSIMPFLNDYVPHDLAVKGLSKINPTLGKFINTALNQGQPIENVKDFIKNKVQPEEQEQKKTPDQRSIIEQYSPELYNFLKEEIGKGRQPLEAGALAQNLGKFNKEIKKMSDDHKTPFSSIIESVFGSAQQPQQQTQSQQTIYPQVMPEEGPGHQALMSILEKLQQSRGR